MKNKALLLGGTFIMAAGLGFGGLLADVIERINTPLTETQKSALNAQFVRACALDEAGRSFGQQIARNPVVTSTVNTGTPAFQACVQSNADKNTKDTEDGDTWVVNTLGIISIGLLGCGAAMARDGLKPA